MVQGWIGAITPYPSLSLPILAFFTAFFLCVLLSQNASTSRRLVHRRYRARARIGLAVAVVGVTAARYIPDAGLSMTVALGSDLVAAGLQFSFVSTILEKPMERFKSSLKPALVAVTSVAFSTAISTGAGAIPVPPQLPQPAHTVAPPPANSSDRGGNEASDKAAKNSHPRPTTSPGSSTRGRVDVVQIETDAAYTCAADAVAEALKESVSPHVLGAFLAVATDLAKGGKICPEVNAAVELLGKDLRGLLVRRGTEGFLLLGNSTGEVVAVNEPFVRTVRELVSAVGAIRVQHPVNSYGADLFVVTADDGSCGAAYRYRTTSAEPVLAIDQALAPTVLMISADRDQLPRIIERSGQPLQSLDLTFSGPTSFRVAKEGGGGVLIDGPEASKYRPTTVCRASVALSQGAP